MRLRKRAGDAPTPGTSPGTSPGTPPAPPVPDPAARDVDDLPGFFAHPPGSPPALTAAPDVVPGAAGEREGQGGDRGDDQGDDRGDGRGEGPSVRVPGRRGRRTAALVAGGAAVVVLGVVATAVVVTGGGDASPTGAGPTSGSPTSAGQTTARPPTSPTGTAATGTAAPLTAAAAGDLAGTDLPTGDVGFTAAVSFAAVVLEPRAVGVTVAYPELQVSSDGSSTVAHLDLPVWNCLSTEPPADPVAGQCSRSVEEFADLGSPELDVVRTGARVDLAGAFATYTRPNGSAPAYTGRSYTLTVQLTPAAGGVTGTLTLGGTQVGTAGAGSFSG